MARTARNALVALLALACLAGPASLPAYAAPPLQLTGLLALSVAPAAGLTTSGSTASGSLGLSTVVDGRLGGTGYDVAVSSAGFDLVGATGAPSPTTHIDGSAARVQVTATTGGTASSLVARTLPANPLFRLAYPAAVLSLDLTSSFTLSLSIDLPAAAAVGRYTGTVTQTVV